jgi:hypothetical protein
VVDKINDNDPIKIKALLTILNALNEISDISDHKYYSHAIKINPEVDYLLQTNKAGRKFIMGQQINLIRPQLWPIILETASPWHCNNLGTGMFYLINHHESPILQHIITMQQQNHYHHGNNQTKNVSNDRQSVKLSDDNDRQLQQCTSLKIKTKK